MTGVFVIDTQGPDSVDTSSFRKPMRRSGRSNEDDDGALSEELQEFVIDPAKGSKSGENKSGENKPDENKPGESKSDESKSDESKSDESKSDESKSDERKSSKNCTCSINLSQDDKNSTDLITPHVQVDHLPFKASGSHLITKRITIAGGFLDIALFTNNCEQLKFVLELGEFHIYYNEVLALLITSLVLQLLIGLTMFLLGCHVTQKASDENYFNFLNHATMGLVALITVINIFIGTFGPKGTVMARCLGAFAYPNTYGTFWKNYINATRHYMASVDF